MGATGMVPGENAGQQATGTLQNGRSPSADLPDRRHDDVWLLELREVAALASDDLPPLRRERGPFPLRLLMCLERGRGHQAHALPAGHDDKGHVRNGGAARI